ncbi:hypothetical protein BDW59DRAFT_74865 [Aspergillus cavernicola]|uniref:Zn(2)-C6 fungal-type domain-containing protein n=1 Tax=Aspergillus cavernicola TaxID=176166 RepID=A0ABR4IBQ6_9EURO
MTQRRPYRSHKVPACDRCRRFKRRCTGGAPDRPCVLCNLQEVPCEYASSPRQKRQSASDRSAIRTASQWTAQPSPAPNPPPQLSSANAETGQDQVGSDYHGGPNQDHSKPELSMVASPVISEDIRILERYMSSQAISQTGSSAPANNPMVYLKVPRRREGLAMAENPGKQQKEILMQILKPYANELLDLYFEHIHPAFPVFEQDSFTQLYRANKISPTLTCDFFALSLILWNHSPTLKKIPQPDPLFVWNLAVEALQQDFLAPGLSTLYAVSLDLVGRPIFSVLGNAINNGRAVSLALSMGLNRNPCHWKRPDIERDLRCRLWWAVLIHDHWSSFAHGTPSMIHKDQYDVPIPTCDELTANPRRSEKDGFAYICFSRLCSLTLILGDILPLAYNLTIDQQEIWKQIRHLEFELDRWDDRLPDGARAQDGDDRRVPGCSSLRLGYLTVRLLLKRIALHVATVSPDADGNDNVAYHLGHLRRSAQEIVNYICALSKAQLQEFWLPYTAHHLILAVIILLRCTVESEPLVADKCRSDLDRLWTKLQTAAKEGWDLANICIAQCAESVSKILTMSASSTATAVDAIEVGPTAILEYPDPESGMPMQYIAPEMMPDILPFSNPELSFDNQWDVGGLSGLGWMDMFPST